MSFVQDHCRTAEDVRAAAERVAQFRRRMFRPEAKSAPRPLPRLPNHEADAALSPRRPKPDIRPFGVWAVIRATADYFGMEEDAILSRDRNYKLTLARQIGMYVAGTITGYSYPHIGRAFGGMDHTTILHGYRKIKALIAAGDQPVAEAAKAITALLCERWPGAFVISSDHPGVIFKAFTHAAENWTEAQVEELLALGMSGLEAKVIAAKIGRTPEAVRNKARRLGFFFRRGGGLKP